MTKRLLEADVETHTAAVILNMRGSMIREIKFVCHHDLQYSKLVTRFDAQGFRNISRRIDR